MEIPKFIEELFKTRKKVKTKVRKVRTKIRKIVKVVDKVVKIVDSALAVCPECKSVRKENRTNTKNVNDISTSNFCIGYRCLKCGCEYK